MRLAEQERGGGNSVMASFFLPTEIVSGARSFDQLGKLAARYGQRALLVCGTRFAQASGLLSRACSLLEAQGVQTVVFDAVAGEARLSVVETGRRLARERDCQLILGLGGGSAIDTAKAIAGLVDLPLSAEAYHDGAPLKGPGRPLIAVPTTAGTGAEVTKNAVLINEKTHVKKSIRDDSWFARVAIVDPELTLSMPPSITAASGSDALCQAIEAYTSIAATAITDALAEKAISLIGKHLIGACEEGTEIPHREAMSLGSLLAGMAMANARLGGVHGMAHPLGAHFGIPHGVICGLLLPYTMAYNLSWCPGKYARVAELLGEERGNLSDEALARRGIDRIQEMLKRIGIPLHLRELGVRKELFDRIIQESLPSGSLKHNPRPLAAEDVRRILETAF